MLALLLALTEIAPLPRRVLSWRVTLKHRHTLEASAEDERY